MAHYLGTLETSRPAEEVFAYMSDFSTTGEWDPGVAEAQRLDQKAIGVGSEFRVVAAFLGREIPLVYRITEYDPPRLTTLRAESSTVVSLDTITVESHGGVTHITYDANLSLQGALKLFDPVLALVFKRLGDRALAGLRGKLGTAEPKQLPRLSGRALDGAQFALPADLRQPFNVILAAFRREQQPMVDGWLPWLSDLEQRRSDIAFFELPILSSAYNPVRWFIDGGMARGVPDQAAQARTITVYTDVDAALSGLGLTGTDTIAVLLVERSGRILHRELGSFDEQKAQQFASALEPGDPARP